MPPAWLLPTHLKNSEQHHFLSRCTYLALFAGICLATDSNTHTQERPQYKRMYIRKSPGIRNAFISEKFKKAVAVSEEKIQEHWWRRGRFSSGHFPCRKMPKPLQGQHIVCRRKVGAEFSSSVEICWKISSKEFWTATAFSSLLIFPLGWYMQGKTIAVGKQHIIERQCVLVWGRFFGQLPSQPFWYWTPLARGGFKTSGFKTNSQLMSQRLCSTPDHKNTTSGVQRVRWDRVYGTNLDQAGLNWAKLDQLGQVGRHLAVFRLLRKALLTKLDQVGPALFPTVFRALPTTYLQSPEWLALQELRFSSVIPRETPAVLRMLGLSNPFKMTTNHSRRVIFVIITVCPKTITRQLIVGDVTWRLHHRSKLHYFRLACGAQIDSTCVVRVK